MSKMAVKINPLVGERIKTLLRERGKPAKWLAEQMHITAVHLSNIVRGKKSLTEYNAKRIVELFPDIRYEWIMGIDDYQTDKDKASHDKNKKRAIDLSTVLLSEHDFTQKITALKHYFMCIDVSVTPPIEKLIPKNLANARNDWEARNQKTGYFPDGSLNEESLFVLTKQNNDGQDVICGVCTGADLVALSDLLFEFAEFELRKFNKKSSSLLSHIKAEKSDRYIQDAYYSGLMINGQYNCEKMTMWRKVSEEYFSQHEPLKQVYRYLDCPKYDFKAMMESEGENDESET